MPFDKANVFPRSTCGSVFVLSGVGLGFDGDGSDGAGAGTDANDGAAAASGQWGKMIYCAGNGWGRCRQDWGLGCR